ncbi:unnamed protein product [Diatraea saccharalis]|uniref:THAP-type domain-containing protein n=1 Tax=Diatraea saccharalis TaxID=40085 RepID=A0A9N9QUG9_9NEOP|nr:unnamed protein product [Diatraea saccharalis]
MPWKGSCIIPCCSNQGLYRFPTDETLRSKWIKESNLHRFSKRVLRPYSKICGDHFVISDFKITCSGKKKLLPGAIPRFPWSTPPLTSSPHLENDDIGSPILPTLTYTRILPFQFVEEVQAVQEPDLVEEDPLSLNDKENEGIPEDNQGGADSKDQVQTR